MPPAIKKQPISVEPGTIEILKGQAAHQLEDQRERDDAWIETSLVITQENGGALDPESATRHFRQAADSTLIEKKPEPVREEETDREHQEPDLNQHHYVEELFAYHA